MGGWAVQPACMQGVWLSGGDGCPSRVASWAPPLARCPLFCRPASQRVGTPHHCLRLCRYLPHPAPLLQINASEATIFKAWHPDAEMVFNMGGQDLEVGGRLGGWVVHVCDVR